VKGFGAGSFSIHVSQAKTLHSVEYSDFVEIFLFKIREHFAGRIKA